MNKYVLMLAAAGLISAAPAYYAFQAQADEAAPSVSGEATPDEAAADEAASADEATQSPEAAEPAAGDMQADAPAAE